LNFKTVWLITVGLVRNINLASGEDFDEIIAFQLVFFLSFFSDGKTGNFIKRLQVWVSLRYRADTERTSLETKKISQYTIMM
jgi:hypothetical protein